MLPCVRELLQALEGRVAFGVYVSASRPRLQLRHVANAVNNKVLCCCRVTQTSKRWAHRALQSKPPWSTGSCAHSSSCRHSCVLAADASPAVSHVLLAKRKMEYQVRSTRAAVLTTELGDCAAWHAAAQKGIQLRASTGALQSTRDQQLSAGNVHAARCAVTSIIRYIQSLMPLLYVLRRPSGHSVNTITVCPDVRYAMVRVGDGAHCNSSHGGWWKVKGRSSWLPEH